MSFPGISGNSHAFSGTVIEMSALVIVPVVPGYLLVVLLDNLLLGQNAITAKRDTYETKFLRLKYITVVPKS